jgi:hypothetical protein
MNAQNSLTVDTTRRTRADNRLLNATNSNATAEGVSIFSACSFAKQHILIWDRSVAITHNHNGQYNKTETIYAALISLKT